MLAIATLTTTTTMVPGATDAPSTAKHVLEMAIASALSVIKVTSTISLHLVWKIVQMESGKIRRFCSVQNVLNVTIRA